MRRLATGCAFLIAWAIGPAAIARAEGPGQPGRIMPLERLPADKLQSLAPLLHHGDMALIESNPDGSMKQVTLMLFVAAPPEVVHDVVGNPGDYRKFIPNLVQSTWDKRPDGKHQSTWRMKLSVTEFDGINVYDFEPGPTGPIFLHAIDPNDDATYRWEFLPVQGGTVAVQYGYTDVRHSNSFIRSFLKRQPPMEHGLGLAAQLVMAMHFRAEAQRRAGPQPAPAEAPPGNFNFLLDRGQVAVMRSDAAGHVSDVSVMDKVFAPRDKVAAVLAAPGEFQRVIPGVAKAYLEEPDKSGGLNYFMEMSLPIVTWATSYTQRQDANGFEGIGVKGDLGGAHYRWDLMARKDGSTLVVYRVNQKIATNVIVKKLFQLEHTLEHGVNVALGLVLMRGVRGAAEGWSRSAEPAKK